MGRLIDAGKVLNNISGMLKSMEDYDAVRKVINNMPTAYDVDKVVEKLEEIQDKAVSVKNKDISIYATGMMGKTIEIVKAGGKEGN